MTCGCHWCEPDAPRNRLAPGYARCYRCGSLMLDTGYEEDVCEECAEEMDGDNVTATLEDLEQPQPEEVWAGEQHAA